MGKQHQSPKKSLTFMHLLPYLFIAAGGLLLLCVGGMKWYTNRQQDAMLAAYAAVSTAIPAAAGTMPDAGMLPDPDQPAAERDAEEADAAAINPQDTVTPICVLTIPKIDLTVAVGEGVDNATLRCAVGHFEGTALAGETGNFCLIGHRNYTFGEFFNRLDELAAGDSILVDRGGQAYTYTVTETFVVEPQEIWVLDPSEDAQITLITCTPVRIATHRLIVKGTLNT